jgi:hypothetical protein
MVIRPGSRTKVKFGCQTVGGIKKLVDAASRQFHPGWQPGASTAPVDAEKGIEIV